MHPGTVAAGLKWFHSCGKCVAVTENNSIFKNPIFNTLLAQRPSRSLLAFPGAGGWSLFRDSIFSPICFLEVILTAPVVRQGLSGWGPWLGESPRMHIVRPDNLLVPLWWRRLKSLSGVPPASFSTATFREFPGCLGMMEISPQPPVALIGICGPFCKLFGSFCLHRMMTIRKKRKRKSSPSPEPSS